MKKKILTLCIIHEDNRILLAMKKKGHGVGKWNAFGGKVEPGEKIQDAAIREVKEECNLDVNKIEKKGILEFNSVGREEILQVHIFEAKEFTGKEMETDEMRPKWFNKKDIPYKEMWTEDSHWLPIFLEGKKFTGTFFEDENMNYVKHEIKLVSNI